jgi:DNA-binding beta-propeller fold protein YncE
VAAQEFNCPNCGAPLDYEGSGATMRCTYCETSVMVPIEMRLKAQHEEDAEDLTSHEALQSVIDRLGGVEAAAATTKSSSGYLVGIILVSVLILVGGIIAVSVLTKNRSNQMGGEVAKAAPTTIPLATQVPIPTLVPTQSFARLVTTFSSKGIGPGLLNDARYITVDGAGTVYIADYQGGRIQAFDADGKFLHGWQVGDAKTVIYGLSASQAGTVYVSYKGDIYRFEGASGKALGKLEYELGPEFGDLAALPDGGVLGMWYESRWGLITSREGHRDDLVWFDADGKTVRRLESAISEQTDSTEVEVSLAVDGLGNVYAMSEYEDAIFKFSSEGKFLDRINLESSVPNQSMWADCIAVDGQGRVYVGGSLEINVFSPEGRFILSFKTETSVRMMAFSPQGDLYIVSTDSASRYKLGELP